MTQAERDRPVSLKKANNKLITQKQAAEELGISERHVRRLLGALNRRGDQTVVHALRGTPSNRKIEEEIRRQAVEILSREVYRGFGPTLASEHLRDRHGIKAGKETVRQQIENIHEWRPRRSRFGELVQWDTSDHDWLEGRGERMKLIAMIDDATGKRFGRFVRSDSTAENMNVLEAYVLKYGRMVNCYTDRASLFQTAQQTRRGESRDQKDRPQLPPTQIERALKELDIVWIPAYSPQARGRVERSFGVAQDRLVKGMRVAGVTTLEQANQYLEEEYLP